MICDVSLVCMVYYNELFMNDWYYYVVFVYMVDCFDEMLWVEKLDEVFVCFKDLMYYDYIVWVLYVGCDVIMEKLMMMDVVKCCVIFDVVKVMGKKVCVVFNYCWVLFCMKVKELIVMGVIGKVYLVNLEYLFDMNYGVDYFCWWYVNVEDLGMLFVYKSMYYFDLVNWWFDVIL